jgi:hypothetical protein|tara:strand:- start:3598 stop:3789 length:192 start_codon:yes stop_codon:yes gene_type:complete
LTDIKPERVIESHFRATCEECGTPIFQLEDGAIVIHSRHHSNRHFTSIRLSDLVRIDIATRGV